MSKATSSDEVHRPPQHQVFINFRGSEIRGGFISHLVEALKTAKVNVFIDSEERTGRDLTVFFKRIEESRIAIAVISSLYTESDWCLDELAKIKRCVKKETLEVFPVFYKVPVDTVRNRTGEFGEKFEKLVQKFQTKRKRWRKALRFVTDKKGEVVDGSSTESLVIHTIVKDVKLALEEITTDQETKSPTAKLIELRKEEPESSSLEASSLSGLKARMGQVIEKLHFKSKKVTRVIGVVGMPGIGKTTLVENLLRKCGWKFFHTMFLRDVGKRSRLYGYQKLLGDLLCGLNNSEYDGKIPLETLKAEFRDSKVFIVLDDVTDENQIIEILGEREWFKEGSRVIITTNSKSLLEGLVDDTYLVPGLSDSDALEFFERHAFPGSCKPRFKRLAREIVDYSMGNPLAIKVLGTELHGMNKAQWKLRLRTLTKSPISNTIQNVLRIPYDDLSTYHKDLFLDVACFFRFEDEYYVRSLLDSSDDTSVSEIRNLVDKFFINICGGRLEMNDLMYTLAMGLLSQSTSESTTTERRLVNHDEIIVALRKKEEAENVRGIFLNMSEVHRICLGSDTFVNMKNLRYLKFFESSSPQGCEAKCNLEFPNGLKFKLQEIRYLHWLKFPQENFPTDFEPRNLIDLKLPYSKIEKIWEGEKDTSKLMWLDLKYSSKLHTLSGLSQARKLQSMNLEGCTALETIHEELQNMKSLVFLNLRGCTSLVSLPEMNLISLKTIILSGCSNLEVFNMISNNLEELYLDGTAIKGLPPKIGDLKRLVFLILKDCKELVSLPDSIGNLKALEKLVLSGCSRFASFPEVKENMKHLKTLLLDGTTIKESSPLSHCVSVDQGQSSSWTDSKLRKWPHGVYGLSFVQRLCLSRNKFRSLPNSISYLYNLKWLELKLCDKLLSLPMLPPNLHYLDAHGCSSLEKIESPLALLWAETELPHSTFIFTDCTKLDQVAKNRIVAYVRRKIQLMSDEITHQDKGSILDVLIGVCYPSWQLPEWFNHRGVGSEMTQKIPRNWREDGFTGIALCAVVSFKNYRAQNNRLLVRCTGEIKEDDECLIQFSCHLGGWTEHDSDTPRDMTKSSGHAFIGYTNLLNIKKRDRGGECKATFKFEVTDGTRLITNCKVLKCGFTLIYAPTKPVHSLCTEKHSDHSEIAPASTTSLDIKGEECETGATNGETEDIIRCEAKSVSDSSTIKGEVPLEIGLEVTPKKNGNTDTGSNEKDIEIYYQTPRTATSVLSAALEVGSETKEKVKYFKANFVTTSSNSFCIGDGSSEIESYATPKMDNKSISYESVTPGSPEEGEVIDAPEKEDSNQGVKTTEEDTEEPVNDQSLTDGTNKLFEVLEKPIRLICLVISIYTVATFALRNEKKKR